MTAPELRTVSSAMRQLVERRALAAGELQGVPWMDVDTPADHAAAERMLSMFAASAIDGAPRA